MNKQAILEEIRQNAFSDEIEKVSDLGYTLRHSVGEKKEGVPSMYRTRRARVTSSGTRKARMIGNVSALGGGIAGAAIGSRYAGGAGGAVGGLIGALPGMIAKGKMLRSANERIIDKMPTVDPNMDKIRAAVKGGARKYHYKDIK